jgi:hypothetical protein
MDFSSRFIGNKNYERFPEVIGELYSKIIYFVCVDAFSERQILKKNRRRCSLVRRGRSATWREAAVLSGQARTVRGLGPNGPRPGAGAWVLCLTAGRSARAQGRRKSPAAAWISLPGGTPSGRRDPRGCLGSGRPT